MAIASISVNSVQKCTQKIPLQLLLRAKKKLEEEKVTMTYNLYSQDARLISHQVTGTIVQLASRCSGTIRPVSELSESF